MKLGFDKIVVDRTEEYLRLKKELGFIKYPDFLGLKNGKWFRVEVECFSETCIYTYESHYAEIVLCYEETKVPLT